MPRRKLICRGCLPWSGGRAGSRGADQVGGENRRPHLRFHHFRRLAPQVLPRARMNASAVQHGEHHERTEAAIHDDHVARLERVEHRPQQGGLAGLLALIGPAGQIRDRTGRQRHERRARPIGRPMPGCWVFACGYCRWFAGVSGMVNVKPSTNFPCLPNSQPCLPQIRSMRSAARIRLKGSPSPARKTSTTRRKPLLIRAVVLAISMDMKKPSLAFHWGVNQGGLLHIAKVRA